jgi:Fungal trichothecene efflux pump (TRI12)
MVISFTSKLTCRIFYINIPVVVIVVIGIYFFLTLKTDTSSIKSKLQRIDVVGIIVFVGSATSFLFGLTAGGVLFPWKSANVIAPLVIGIFGMVGFWAWEDYVAKEPMMPMRVFKERTALAGFFGTWVHGMILWGLIYYMLLWVYLIFISTNFSAKLSSLTLLSKQESMHSPSRLPQPHQLQSPASQ